MDNPVLAEMIRDLPFLLDEPDLVRRLLHHTHARIDHYAAAIDEAAARLDTLRRMDRLLRQTLRTADEEVGSAAEAVEARLRAFLRQRRNFTQVLAFLLFVRALAFARTRSRLVPAVLLAAASAAAFPGLSTLVRLSVLTLGFLFSSDQPPAGGGV
jgi:hypothetical protein